MHNQDVTVEPIPEAIPEPIPQAIPEVIPPATLITLPPEQIIDILAHLDETSQIHVSRINKYMNQVFKLTDTYHDIEARKARIKALYQNLPAQTKALMNQRGLVSLFGHGLNINLSALMRQHYAHTETRPRLKLSDLHEIATGYYWIMHQLEYPCSPMKEIKPITDEMVETIDRDDSYRRIYAKTFWTIMFTIGALGLCADDLFILFMNAEQYREGIISEHAINNVLMYMATMAVLGESGPNIEFFDKFHVLELYPDGACGKQFREWLMTLHDDFIHAKGEFVDLNLRNIRNRAFSIELFKKVSKVATVLALFPGLYVSLFTLAPGVFPIMTLAAPRILYGMEQRHEAAHVGTMLPAMVSLQIGSQTILLSALYATVFAFAYHSDTITDTVDDKVYLAEDQVRASLAAMTGGAAVLGFLLTAKLVQYATPKIFAKTNQVVLSAKDTLSDGATYVTNTMKAWCPSWRRNNRERDIEANFSSVNHNEHTPLISSNGLN